MTCFWLMTGLGGGVTYLQEMAPTNHQDLLVERVELAVELEVVQAAAAAEEEEE